MKLATFIISTVFFLQIFFPNAKARSITEVYGQGQPEYHSLVYKKILSWFQKNHPYFHFSKNENNYSQECLSHIASFGESLSENIIYNYLHISKMAGSNSPFLLAIGCPNSFPKKTSLVNSILTERGLRAPKGLSAQDVYWIEWSSSSRGIKIYFKNEKNNLMAYAQEGHQLKYQFTLTALPHPENEALIPPYLLPGVSKAIQASAEDQKRTIKVIISLTSLDTYLLKKGFQDLVTAFNNEFGLVPDQVEIMSNGEQWLNLL